MNVLCKNVVCSCYYVLFRICTLSFREELKSIASVHPLRVTGLALQKLPLQMEGRSGFCDHLYAVRY
jgi:hypothetical protein